ncbi:MAG: putative ribosomal protein [Candidatus Parcubacteria bacterium]|jgi:large subunit ribosomal protein L23
MALFGSKKNTPKKAAAKAKTGGLADVVKSVQEGAVPEKKKSAPIVALGLKQVLVRPRITEKAANLTSNDVYTFDVVPSATKVDIMKAVKALYKVTPVKINIVNVKGKRKPLKTRRGFGTRNANRKAYIFLKKGEQIDFAS